MFNISAGLIKARAETAHEKIAFDAQPGNSPEKAPTAPLTTGVGRMQSGATEAICSSVEDHTGRVTSGFNDDYTAEAPPAGPRSPALDLEPGNSLEQLAVP